MSKRLLSLCLAVAFVAGSAQAQQLSKDFQITKLTPDMVITPEYNFSYGPKNKKVSKNKDWLEVEVSFDWQPREKKPEFLDELTFNYYILLNNKSRENPQGTLLTGSVTHVALPQAKAMNSVMYVSPRTLERFFEGKIPNSAVLGSRGCWSDDHEAGSIGGRVQLEGPWAMVEHSPASLGLRVE